MANILPTGKQQFFDTTTGEFLENGYLYTYENGTETPKATYSNAAGSVQQANPIRLNARGEATNPIFWNGLYTIALHDANDVLIYTVPDYGVEFINTEFTQSGTGAVSSSVQTELRRSYYVSQFSTPEQAATAAANERLYVNNGETVTLNVPSAFASISAAFNAIKEWVIAAGGLVVIQAADDTHTFSSALRVDHPYGEYIQILGNTTTPSNCIISCANSDAFYLGPGFQFGKINGFRIIKTGANEKLGILTDGGRYLKVGPKIEVDNFYYGISARNGGYINAGGDATDYVTVTNSGDVGIWAYIGSYVNCEYARVSGSDDSTNGLGGGIVAEFASSIQANYAQCTSNWLVGISSLSGSSIRAWGCTCTGNGNTAGDPSGGLYTGSLGTIEIFNGSTITGNTGYAHFSDGAGQIYGLDSATTTGNSLGVRRTPMRLRESDKAMRVESGSLRIDATQPACITDGNAYSELDAAATKSLIWRALIAEVERGRLQYRDDFDVWELVSDSKVLLRAFDSGKVTIGKASPATSDTAAIGVQIPAVAGAPSGVVTDTSAGYVTLAYDATNNKLCVYNGGWKTITLS